MMINEIKNFLNQMGMSAKVMPKADVGYIDFIMCGEIAGSPILPVAVRELDGVEQDHLMQWCTENALYQVPTIELVEWLREKIGDRSAIEICAGKGGIGRALGIPSTDSYQQTTPEMRAYYSLMRQPIIVPPDYVEKIEANEAVRKYKPEVVIGCFVTQRWRSEEDADGNMFGPLEEEWVEDGVTYIHVGNEHTHRNKRILSLPHETFHFPWLRSRAIDQSKNVIWVWNDDNQ
jgi:hypothetical protein